MIESINLQLPTCRRNYCTVDWNKLTPIVNQGEQALPSIKQSLATSNDETEILENLYTLDIMLDNGVQGIDKLYPELSRFNDTKSPNIQTFLAGIYRKTQIPDAFGPLVSMLINNSVTEAINNANGIKTQKNFDPNEEIGGAIISYLA
ncbi:hypothetical protein IJI31_04425 [bacterium]|nr:hypothetical protein [bacterium]